MSRVLIGTVGYHNLCNHSVGPILLPRLQAMQWPPQVLVEEMNWGPVAIVQRFQAETSPFERVVFLTARPDARPEGELTLYRWAGTLPSLQEIQQRVGEAVTGVISLDNLLIIGEHFSIWPSQVFVVDVAPGPEKPGSDLSDRLLARVPEILRCVHELALGTIPSSDKIMELKGSEIGVNHTP